MIDPNIMLGKVVVATLASDLHGASHITGVMVGYHADPTVLIDTGDGIPRCWSAQLCRKPSTEEAIEYWQRRSMEAESRLKELQL